MVSISLADVVAFLRARGALGVLEGAPVVRHNDRSGWIHRVGIRAFERGTNPDHDAALYLGDGEICPAAEGWAARVLALAIADIATHLDFSSLSVAELLRRDRLLARWIWHDYPPRTLSFRERPIIGAPPATPAARLAAVLHYEMECAR